MKKLIFSVIVMCLLLAVPAMATEVKYGNFQIEVVNDLEVYWDPAQNDGYPYPEGDPMWYDYPQSPQTWWNEWWYDDPWQEGGKWVRIIFNYGLLDPALPGDVMVTLNWTNGTWIGQAAPPTWENSVDPEAAIERLYEYEGYEDWYIILPPQSPDGSWDSGRFLLPVPYNPEWVSVDVQGGGNVAIWGGVLEHECVPEPATLVLLGLGGLLLRRRKS